MAKLVGVHEAMARLDAAWADADDAADLSRGQLIAVNAAIGMLQRRVDAVQADVAAGIARESRPELGAESLAKQQGFRNPATLIAAVSGKSTGMRPGWWRWVRRPRRARTWPGRRCRQSIRPCATRSHRAG